MNFLEVEKIANTILYEGYILYPYRATAIKNRQRWNFGTLYPSVYAQAQRPLESSGFIAECLLQDSGKASVDIRVSFLQLIRPAGLPAEQTLSNPNDPSLDWERAAEHSANFSDLGIDAMTGSPRILGFNPAPGIHAELTVKVELLASGAYKMRLGLENCSELASGECATRDEALPYSLVSAHLLVGITSGEFISLLEPEDVFVDDVKGCNSKGVFPVLAGNAPDRSMILVSPIILYDYPQVAPESPGDYFDGTEMDEMLTLRVLTLTDAEKDEMRRGDPRACRILERTEALTTDEALRAHGVIRQMFNPRLFEAQEDSFE